VPKVPGEAWTTQPYRNSTHSFDVEFCEWNLKIHNYALEYDGVTYENQYEIVGATVDEIKFDPELNSISIQLIDSENGLIQIIMHISYLNQDK